VDVKDTPQRVRGVGVQVRSVPIFGGLVEVVVLPDELLELRLDAGEFVGREVVFDNGDFGGFQMGEESGFMRLQEEQGLPLLGGSGGAADSVDLKRD
jgi:hypothetical protein